MQGLTSNMRHIEVMERLFTESSQAIYIYWLILSYWGYDIYLFSVSIASRILSMQSLILSRLHHCWEKHTELHHSIIMTSDDATQTKLHCIHHFNKLNHHFQYVTTKCDDCTLTQQRGYSAACWVQIGGYIGLSLHHCSQQTGCFIMG